MLKNIPKILSALFLLVFALQLVLVVGFAFYPAETQATTFDPQIDIGAGVSEIGANSIGQYIKAIYNYAIGVVGILATVVMMIGGIVWITAGGNQTRISEAKAWIGASLTGLVLALASYTILSMINTDLVEFQPVKVDKVSELDNSLDLDGNPYSCNTDEDCNSGSSNNFICLNTLGVCSDLMFGSPCENLCHEGDCIGNICSTRPSVPRANVVAPSVSSCANAQNGTLCKLMDGGTGCCHQYNCYPPDAYTNNTGLECNP